MKTLVLMLLSVGVLVFPCRGVAQTVATPSNNPVRVEVSKLPEISVQKSWTEAGSFWLNSALLVVAIAGVVLAWKNLTTITGQLREMQNSAKREAELNRPWLLFEGFDADGVFRDKRGLSHGKDGPKLRFRVINRGLTPAKVKAWEFRVESGGPSKPDKPPLQPEETSGVPIKIFPAGIGCEREAEFSSFNNEEQRRLGCREAVLWAEGAVQYEDIYGVSHEARFCYRSTDDPLLHCPTLEEAGPDEYRRIT
jgi:hypothetical protein